MASFQKKKNRVYVGVLHDAHFAHVHHVVQRLHILHVVYSSQVCVFVPAVTQRFSPVLQLINKLVVMFGGDGTEPCKNSI